ncbi:hypothetical protein ABZW11_07965 [Nonomuraea sp. NPDC004580]|uniref:hypothetical protein n=1 Tax=Nonomuraea sp. NPDC004580 TaxID=3154552 RepID=UPI0033A55A9C
MLSLAGIAPYGADGLDWFAGMIPSGVAALGTAAGRKVRAAWLAEHCPAADLRLLKGDSHFTVVTHAEAGLEWLCGVA